jgi:hypothetical protein
VHARFSLTPVFLTSCQSHDAEFKPKVTAAGFGIYGDQSVFGSEMTRAADDANLKTIATTLQSVFKTMDTDNDVLFLILTSHGSICDVERRAADIVARAVGK